MSPDRIKKLFTTRWFFTVFALMATISTIVGVRHSIATDIDFQWPAAHFLAHRRDPWTEALGSHRDLTNSASVPNYLHELYVLYLPLTLLSEHVARLFWTILNIVMSVLSIRMISDIYDIRSTDQLSLFLILASSVSFRAGIGAGQFCFAELFLFCVIYRFPLALFTRGVSLGLSFAKYSFSPVITFTFLFKRRWVALFAAVLPVAAGLGVCMSLLSKPLLPLAMEPFFVARHGVSPGFADLMTLAERIGGSRIAVNIYAVAFLAALVYAIRLASRRQLTPAAEFACITVATLLLFKHLIYDYVFLIVPLAYALWGEELKAWARWIVLCITAYIWFVSPVYIGRDPFRRALPLLIFNCTCTVALLIAVDMGRIKPFSEFALADGSGASEPSCE